jgi:hypothetical protein
VACVAARRADGSLERALDDWLRDEAFNLRIRRGDYGLFASARNDDAKADCVRVL